MKRKDETHKADLRMLGARIRDLRTAKSLSQIQFSALAGISNKQLCNIEKANNWPSLPVYVEICRHLGVVDLIVARHDA